MKKRKFLDIKAHNLIFVYFIFSALIQLLVDFFNNDLTIDSTSKIMSNTILYIGCGFLIKFNFKFASLIFIIPIIVQTISFYKFGLTPFPMMTLYQKVFDVVNYIFYIIIVFFIFKKSDSSDLC